MNLIHINLNFWQQILKGKKYIVILMVEFLDSRITDDKNLYFWHS